MKHLIILPLFFLSVVSYSQPDCGKLKTKIDQAYVVATEADVDWLNAHAYWITVRADYEKAYVDYEKALEVRDKALENVRNAFIVYHRAVEDYEEHCGLLTLPFENEFRSNFLKKDKR